MTIDSGGLDSFRLFTGRALSLREQKFALEQARFDRAGPAKSPQEVCQPMNERKLDRCSRIDTADEGTLGRSVVLNIFEVLSDGFGRRAHHAKRGGAIGGVCFAGQCQERPRYLPRRVR